MKQTLSLIPALFLNLPSNSGYIVMFIFGCILIAALLVTIILTVVFSGRHSIYHHSENNMTANVRIYRYNYSNKTFYCFDKLNPKNFKSFDEKAFLAQFKPSDKYRIQDWLNSIPHKETFPKYIQASIRISHSNRMVPTMLEFTSINKKSSLIHFNSHIFPALYTSNSDKKNMAKAKRYTLMDAAQAQAFLDKMDVFSLGATFYFSIYQKDKNGRVIATERVKGLMPQFKQVLGRYLSKTRKMVVVNETDIILVDTSIALRTSAFSTASTFATALQQFMNFNIPDDDIFFGIGFTIGSFYGKDFLKAKFQAQSMVKAIKEGYTDEEIMFYDPKFYEKYAKRKTQNEEILKVIKNNTFRIYYSPTLNLTNKDQGFYFTEIVPYGTSVNDFQEVIRLADDEEGGAEKLFSGIISEMKRTLGNRKASICLFMPFAQINSFCKALKGNADNFSWVLALREADLMTYSDDIGNINMKLASLKKIDGIEIALVIDNASSELKRKTLSLFDFFIIPPSFTSDTLDFNTSHNLLRIIENNYFPYGVPLVFNGLKDFDDIELCAHYSGTMFQCAQLCEPSSHLETIEPEKVEYIVKVTKNLLPNHNDTISLRMFGDEDEKDSILSK